ncbi:hypothetical protein [Lentibacillus sp. CBA3610]|uniref:hypothetical protein n=1 Tax=Lentibacillus sp. CBA3610 TaxID=2518176 RepID=UPI0015955A69|nr:hypothetical protein [Lentibacillus sp. CBA3610]
MAKDLVDEVIQKHQNTGHCLTDHDAILQDVKAEIENRLKALTSKGLSADKKLIQFVGPTGAGKTTTIAKLQHPVWMMTISGIALITADTYRIEQSNS